MSSLTNKRILLGVTGGIAAYKSAELIRRLKERGADVRVVMTPAAKAFITPLTLQALSGHSVRDSLLDPDAEAGMGHIELARWADALIVAPATADFISKLAVGEGSDLLSTVCLACSSPLVLAPAMNEKMWLAEATRENVSLLAGRGVQLWGPASGEQACGDVGPGRMIEPDDIAERAQALFEAGCLAGKKVVITAGPTREAIDPVRYISNHSSGKMGYALAEAAAEAGARTTLISGPCNIDAPERVNVEYVISAMQMHQSALEHARDADVFIAAAAVADYRLAEPSKEKIKKSDDTLTLTLVKNPDIVADIAAAGQQTFVVGFAAETEALLEHAQSKLNKKKLDMIIANDVSAAGIGFNSDDNAVTVLSSEGKTELGQRSKKQLARELIRTIATSLK
ncbi:bifunctional phosphopantothenoylcysteine decarboxylase/phosphopantothenate--cysteine ligase CoaBC [Agaribacterium haliotis]|uniref:bifunctional phosphopantothenoylcysteine decarboxylase/phosphopantothenate--cysteine ligase CoaBC n=1 Tax=Agaribacterium haliotis TaxID=2013869 RepID=UPI000BB56D79|nr:bifunctional phosphopantothenoylcysteine decarboxylase/phosphopantothenate--cysteine ligase CoaBC [Agaribacterium haliotis]